MNIMGSNIILKRLFSWLIYNERSLSRNAAKNPGSAGTGKGKAVGGRDDASGTWKSETGKSRESKRPDRKKAGSEESESIKADISYKLEDNLSYIEQAFNHPDNKDIVLRRLCIGNGVNVFLFYLDGMADRTTINLSILKPLLDKSKYGDLGGKNLFDYVYDSVIETHQIEKADTHEKAINDVLTGNTAICIDGYPNYILCETKGFEKRNVDKPQVEGVVKGSQEAYNENLRTNVTLVRRILKNRKLTTEFIKLGKRNNDLVAVLYLKDLASPSMIAEVKRRLKGLSTDLIIGDGILEQFIEDNPLSIYPTIISTERPDRTVSHLVEGKAAILAEGSPFALIVPVTVFDFLHTPEDTSLRWQFGTFLRFIRLFAFIVASLLPGLYVALTTFHREMIPTDLLIAIAQAKENVPFPTIAEVILMEMSFELIREAGIRIPGIIGNTIGIIGALILGQAAVQANLVSPVLIIIVAFTGLGNFAIPDFNLAFTARIMRLIYIFSGAFLGFFGISLAMVVSLAFAVSQNSFGVPYLSQLAPKTDKNRDLLIRWPIWMQEFRPAYTDALDKRRQPRISRKWILSKPDFGRKDGKDGSK